MFCLLVYRKLDLPDLLVAVTGVKGEDHAVQDIDWMKISTVDVSNKDCLVNTRVLLSISIKILLSRCNFL